MKDRCRTFIMKWLLRCSSPPSDLPRHPPQRKRWEHLCDGAASSNHQCYGQRPQAQHLLPQLQWSGRRQQAPGTSRLSNGHWWQPLRRRPQLCAQGLPIYEHHWHPGIKVSLHAKDQKKVKIYSFKESDDRFEPLRSRDEKCWKGKNDVVSI